MKLQDIFQGRVLTISNFLSFFRILIAPAIIYVMYLESRDPAPGQTYIWIELGGIFVIILTDFLDGKLARALNQVTMLGQFLDPIADKLSYLSVGFFLVLYKGFPAWLYGIALGREVVAVLVGIILFRNKDIDVKPNMFGKLCATSLAFSALAYILGSEKNLFGITFQNLTVFCIVLFLVLGSFEYIRTYFVKPDKKDAL